MVLRVDEPSHLLAVGGRASGEGRPIHSSLWSIITSELVLVIQAGPRARQPIGHLTGKIDLLKLRKQI